MQLQDINGNPALAANNIAVTLTSSDTTIGRPYSSSLTIYEGDSSARTYFSPTYKPGTVTITASSPGLTSGSATIQSIGAVPHKLAVIYAPNKVNADNSYSNDGYNYLVVQLQDLNGNPALAANNIAVTLTSSDTTIGKPQSSSVTIYKGDSSAYTYFSPTNKPGTVTITASSPGLTSGSATVTTVTPSTLSPKKLVVIPAPYKVNADNSYSDDGYNYLVVQLQDANGNPALAPTGGVAVTLTSSDTTIGKPYSSSVTIYAGDSSASTYFSPTYKLGTVTITASSPSLVSGSAFVRTEKLIPPKIEIYTDKSSYSAGEKQYLGLNVTNPGNNLTTKIKIWLELPSGSTYSLIDTTVTLPAGLAYSNPAFRTFTLPSISSGTYRWHAKLIDPVFGDEFSHDIAVWTFT